MLKPCRECKKDASTTARACPHCGAVNPTRSAGEVSATQVFLVVIVICMLILFALGTCSPL